MYRIVCIEKWRKGMETDVLVIGGGVMGRIERVKCIVALVVVNREQKERQGYCLLITGIGREQQSWVYCSVGCRRWRRRKEAGLTAEFGGNGDR